MLAIVNALDYLYASSRSRRGFFMKFTSSISYAYTALHFTRTCILVFILH